MQLTNVIIAILTRVLENSADIRLALRRVGELLALAGDRFAIVIVGGAALNLLGVVRRATRDVDILAFAKGQKLERPPSPIPDSLAAAIRTVARDMALDPDWLNTGPELQWKQGLPRGLRSHIKWQRFAALRVGIVDRSTLIRLKLYAAVDGRAGERHIQDLTALNPNDRELQAAARWVKTQDAGAEFPSFVDQTVAHVRSQRGIRGR